MSWPAFTFSISIRYFFALRSAASLSAAVGFYRSSSRHASYLRIRNNRRSRILRLPLLLQARQSRGERGVAESRSTRQPPLLEATLEGREKQYQNLKNLNGYPRNRLESSGPWRNWVWRRSFHPDSLEDQQAEETEAYRLENEAPSNYLIDSTEARSRSNNANRMRRGMGQDRS